MKRDIRKKQFKSPAPSIQAAYRVIQENVEFSDRCRPDLVTGKEPYRVGWGRSVGRMDESLVVSKDEENYWLRERLSLLWRDIDRTANYKDQATALVSAFLEKH